MTERQRSVVLFLCTGNSARSQMSEALLRHYAGELFESHSAGLEPRAEVHPLALRVLEEIGVDASGLRPKHSRDYLGKVAVRHAIIVCSRANEACPRVYPFAAQTHYWPFEDPAAVEENGHEQLEKFREVRDAIDTRLREWIREEQAR